MTVYAVTLARSARKEIEALPDTVLGRVWTRIEGLADEPRPSGCLKLTGSRNTWRMRVGDWRILYTIDDDRCVVDVCAVLHRSAAYK